MISSQEHILILSIEYFVGGNSSEHNYSSIRMISPIGRNLFLDMAVLCSRISREGIISAVLSMQGFPAYNTLHFHKSTVFLLQYGWNCRGTIEIPCKMQLFIGKSIHLSAFSLAASDLFSRGIRACRIIVIKWELLACIPSSSRNECIPVSSPLLDTCRPDARLTYSVNELEILDVNYSFFT